jgi:hypothetical protein
MRRLAGFGAVLLGALVAWAPAAHADTPTGGWTDPAPTAELDGVPLAFLQQPQQLKGSADIRNGSIAGVEFKLVQDADGAAGTPCSAQDVVKTQTRGGSSSSHVDFAFDAPFPCNKKYKVRATVTPSPWFLHTPRDFDLWVAVAIPSAPTSGLTATVLEGDDRGVKLAWAGGGREPDFAGFEVRRAIGSGAFQAVADVAPGATSWIDEAMPRNGATLRYQVVAMRPGPEPGTTVFSDVGATVSATVAAAPGGTGTGSSSDDPDDASATPRRSGSGVPKGTASSKVHREFSVPGARTTTTLDTGFDEKLPFERRSGDEAAGSSVVDFDDDEGGSTGRSTALLVGGASVTTAWAMLLRLLTRRALVY